MSVIRIGSWTLDTSDGKLDSASGTKRLEPKIQAVLMLLIRRRGTVVTRQEILAEVWHDTHVFPGALARTISLLRQALEDDVRQPRYIETVPKRGYRFIGTVEELEAPLRVALSTDAHVLVAPRTAPRASVGVLVAIGALAVVGPNYGDGTAAPRARAFEYRLWHDTRLGNETAFEHYSRAVAMNPTSVEALAGLATAYAFRANYLPDREGWATAAMKAAEQAVKIDRTSARAAAAAGIAHVQAGRLREAAAYFQRALDLDARDAASRTNLGRVLMATGRVADAIPLFERHVADQPASAAAYAHLAAGLIAAGYLPEGAEAARAAIALQPYELNAHLALVHIDLVSGHLPEARHRLTRLLEVHTDCTQCVIQLGLIDQVEGRNPEAMVRYRQARTMAPRSLPATLRLAQLSMLTGDRAAGDLLLQQVEARTQQAMNDGDQASITRWWFAAAAAVRGDRAQAIERYRQAVAAGRRAALWDRWDPLLSSIQSEAGFIALQAPWEDQHRAAAAAAERVRRNLAAAH